MSKDDNSTEQRFILLSFRTMKILCDKHQTYLEKLEINGTELTDESMNYIDQCRKLESITIEFCINLTGSNFHLFHVKSPFLT